MSWPNLFLMAAPRAGSTQLAAWLDSHPEISLASVKEPNFFSAHEFPADLVGARHLDDVDPALHLRRRRPRRAQFAVFRDAAQYRALFSPLPARWRCDASTSYLACPEAPAAIERLCGPQVRVITVTRDPVERALSHYRLAVRTGQLTAPLAEALARELAPDCPLPDRFLLRPSRQRAGVARVHAVFGPDRHLALRFEEVVADPERSLGQIARFLGVDPGGFDLGRVARNEGLAPRWPALNAWAQRSGLKTRLRRALPPPLKAGLRRLYFRAEPPAPPSEAERALLRTALADEYREDAA